MTQAAQAIAALSEDPKPVTSDEVLDLIDQIEKVRARRVTKTGTHTEASMLAMQQAMTCLHEAARHLTHEEKLESRKKNERA